MGTLTGTSIVKTLWADAHKVNANAEAIRINFFISVVIRNLYLGIRFCPDVKPVAINIIFR